MAEVLLFHHAQGLTPGVLAFADELREAGHVIHTPDLYEGKRFDQIENGVAYAQLIGFDTILERGQMAADDLPKDLVYAGFSLGGMPAQMLAQTRPGAKGALLFHSAIPPSEFGTGWPKGVPLQIHMMEADPFALEGDLDAARQLAETVKHAELFLYPGDRHLFADSSLADYEAALEGLRRLENYIPTILSSREATGLMHHLWMAAYLPDMPLGGEEPILASCPRDAWLRWQRILEARLAFPENEASPYLNFCLAWSLLQLREHRRAISTLRKIEPLTTGKRRRVGSLVVVTDESGKPSSFAGLVRRREGSALVLYSSQLGTEIRVPPAVEAEIAPSSLVGEEFVFFVGVNYRGLLPWSPPKTARDRARQRRPGR